MPKMPLAAFPFSCLHSQGREPSFCQYLGLFPSSKTPPSLFQAPSLRLSPEPHPIPSTALLLPILQPERQPTERCPLYPEQVLRAPPDMQPANRCDQTPGPLQGCAVCKGLWSHLSLSFSSLSLLQKYLENYLNRLLTMSFYRNYHAMVRSKDWMPGPFEVEQDN